MAKVTKSDGENPTYGDYSDPDPKMEVKDSNAYYSSDYEAGTGGSRATDNNPYYEQQTVVIQLKNKFLPAPTAALDVMMCYYLSALCNTQMKQTYKSKTYILVLEKP